MKKYRGYRIKIFTRSMNRALYIQSQRLIHLDYPRVRLMHTTGDGYIYEMVRDRFCDIAINVDEDAFMVDEKALMSLVDYIIDNDYVACGMSDGVELPIRLFNPIIINPFFTIINTKKVREKFNLKEIKNFSYLDHKDELIQQLPERLKKDPKTFDIVDYEPYYPFFFWLAHNFKLLYLPVEEHKDGYTTILKNHEDKTILLHTWWSRSYGGDPFHTNRINSIIAEAGGGVYRDLTENEHIAWQTEIKREQIRLKILRAYWWVERHVKRIPKYLHLDGK